MTSQSVTVVPVPDSIYNNHSLEPPFVRVKPMQYGQAFIDSRDRDTTAYPSPYHFVLSAANLRITNASRIAVQDALFHYSIPNVNVTNNFVGFYLNAVAPANFRLALMQPGFYTTVTTLMTALATAMTTAAGGGVIFTWTPAPLFPDGGAMSVNIGTYIFDSTSIGVKYGRYLWALPIQTASDFNSTFTIRSIRLLHTRFIDIASKELNKYNAKPTTAATNTATTLLIRIFVDSPAPRPIFFSLENLRWFKFDQTQMLTNIDFTAYDEWGNILTATQTSTPSSPDPCDWQMSLLTA